MLPFAAYGGWVKRKVRGHLALRQRAARPLQSPFRRALESSDEKARATAKVAQNAARMENTHLSSRTESCESCHSERRAKNSRCPSRRFFAHAQNDSGGRSQDVLRVQYVGNKDPLGHPRRILHRLQVNYIQTTKLELSPFQSPLASSFPRCLL